MFKKMMRLENSAPFILAFYVLQIGCGPTTLPEGLIDLSLSSTRDLSSTGNSCSQQDLDYWNSRADECTGIWTYTESPCYHEDTSDACPFSHFETEAIIGDLSCPAEGNDPVAWDLVFTTESSVGNFGSMLNHHEVIKRRSIENFGPHAFGTFEEKKLESESDIKYLQGINYACGSTWCFSNIELPTNNVKRGSITSTTTYYHRAGEHFVVQRQTNEHHEFRPDTLISHHKNAMRTSDEELNEGFAVVQWSEATLDRVPDDCGQIKIIEKYYKPIDFAIQPNPRCGQGEIGRTENRSRPIYHACRHDRHGVDVENSCGIDSRLLQTKLGLTRQEIPNVTESVRRSAVCSTGDAENDDIEAKLRKWRSIALENKNSAIRMRAFKKLKLALEVKEHRWHTSDFFTDMIHVQSIGSHACGDSWPGRFDSESYPHISALQDACYRQTGDIITSTDLNLVIEECFNAEHNLHKLHPEEMTRNMSHQFLVVMSRLIEKLINQGEFTVVCGSRFTGVKMFIKNLAKRIQETGLSEGDKQDLLDPLRKLLHTRCWNNDESAGRP